MQTATAPEAQAPTETTATAAEPQVAAGTPPTPTQEAPARPHTPVKTAVSLEDYRKVKEQALRGDASAIDTLGPVETEVSPDSVTVPMTVGHDPEPQPTPPPTPEPGGPTTVPAVEPPPPAAATEPAAPPADDEDKEIPGRIRIKGLPDGDLVAAAHATARAKKIPFGEAWKLVAADQPAAAPAEPAAPTRTRDQIMADIQAADQERDAAAEAADGLEPGAFKRQMAAQKKYETLEGELAEFEIAEADRVQAAQAAEAAKFDNTVESSRKKLVDYWPEAGDPNSALSKRAIEIADAYEADPDLRSQIEQPDSPFKFGQMAATELGLLPAHLRKTAAPPQPPSSKSTAVKPAPVKQTAVASRPVQPAAASPASGANSTTEGNPPPSIVDGIKNIRDYQAVKAQLTGQRA